MRQAGKGVKTLRLALNRQREGLACHMGEGNAVAGAALGLEYVVLQATQLREA